MPIIDEGSLHELLIEDVSLRLVEPQIYSTFHNGDNPNFFDKMARFYDVVICNPLYNRLMWGYSVTSYAAIVHDALAAKDGWVLDVGCGSLAFSAKKYKKCTERPIVFFDHSLNLLRIAKSRMIKLNGTVPSNMVFLQGDALHLPFKPKCFDTIISLNLLHVLADVKQALSVLGNVLADDGTMSFTTLVKNNRRADKYLEKMLKKASGTAPRDIGQLQAVFDELGLPVKYEMSGNMAFIYYGWNS